MTERTTKLQKYIPSLLRNILLAQKGTVAKVSDFGLSHSLYASVEELNNTSAGLPVRWMAPEVLMNRQGGHMTCSFYALGRIFTFFLSQVNNKSDIWSLGCVLYESITL